MYIIPDKSCVNITNHRNLTDKTKKMPVITQLHIYPVKSMQGNSFENAELTVRGLKYDRNWMVVEKNGDFLTQRKFPGMATIRVKISDKHLHLIDNSADNFNVPLKNSNREEVSVEVWGNYCEALDEGDGVSKWLTTVLQSEKTLRLVRFNESFQRKIDRNYLKDEDSHTAFADGFPFLVTSEDSLSILNERLLNSGKDPVTMDRFRPNIVIKGLEPLQENRIDQLTCSDGRYKLGIRKPCKRCKVTTVDQQSGQIANPKEPLRTLTLMKTIPKLHGAYFGQNSTLVSGDGETIKVGDMVVPE